LAHWLAVRLAWVDDELEPLELDPPPPHAARVSPAASSNAGRTPLGFLRAIRDPP
jgi:hypothetical protein